MAELGLKPRYSDFRVPLSAIILCYFSGTVKRVQIGVYYNYQVQHKYTDLILHTRSSPNRRFPHFHQTPITLTASLQTRQQTAGTELILSLIGPHLPRFSSHCFSLQLYFHREWSGLSRGVGAIDQSISTNLFPEK